MKIVDFEEFLLYPRGTVFCKYISEGKFGPLHVKESESAELIDGEKDFTYSELYGTFFVPEGMFEHELWPENSTGGSEFDLNLIYTDGYKDSDQLFAVYEKEDIKLLIKKLMDSL